MKPTKLVIYLGSNGFPFGMAAIQRQLQVSKALKNNNTKILVINRKGVHTLNRIKKEKINTTGTFEEINYLYASGSPLYPSNFIFRNFLKIVGIVVELMTIIFNRVANDLSCIIVNTTSLTQLKYYWFISRLFNIKLVYDYVEYMSSLEDRTMKTTGNKTTFDTVFFNFSDSLIIISPFLERHVNKMAPKIPYLIVPPIMDFEKFASINFDPNESGYFLYCGSTQYTDVIEFILDAYQKTNPKEHTVYLILIVNGSIEGMTHIQNLVKGNNTIKILSDLSYETLIGYYKNAKALLIPLQDNLQDQARFPFKISEYTASARPIVTSNSGAVVDYFTDKENALLAQTGDSSDYAAKLNFILNNPERADEIGLNGYTLGLKHFNYKAYSESLWNLISENVKG